MFEIKVSLIRRTLIQNAASCHVSNLRRYRAPKRRRSRHPMDPESCREARLLTSDEAEVREPRHHGPVYSAAPVIALAKPSGLVRNGRWPVCSVTVLRTGVASIILSWKARLMTWSSSVRT